MDDAHCLLAMRYIERNPIRAAICRLAAKYPWSSAAAHCGQKDGTGLLDAGRWKNLTSGLDWERELSLDLPPEDLSRLRRGYHSGRPLATDRLISKLEHTVGRRLRPLPIGRPRKKSKDRAGGKRK
jgi:putative transposase